MTLCSSCAHVPAVQQFTTSKTRIAGRGTLLIHVIHYFKGVDSKVTLTYTTWRKRLLPYAQGCDLS